MRQIIRNRFQGWQPPAGFWDAGRALKAASGNLAGAFLQLGRWLVMIAGNFEEVAS